MPQRLQMRRTRGWRKPPDAIYVGRPTKWGNPFRVDELGRAEAVRRFRAWIEADAALRAQARAELRGRDLLCWCPIDEPCHADVLVDVSNQSEPG